MRLALKLKVVEPTALPAGIMILPLTKLRPVGRSRRLMIVTPWGMIEGLEMSKAVSALESALIAIIFLDGS